MRTIDTEIVIEAPPEAVWARLADFGGWPQWNPFVRHIEGPLEEGGRLVVRIAPPGGKGMTFRPTVTRMVPGRELAWVGRLVAGFVFEGEHVFRLQPLEGGRTRFVHREHFRGLLVPPMWRSLDTDTRAGFEAMNRALKQAVEAEAGTPADPVG